MLFGRPMRPLIRSLVPDRSEDCARIHATGFSYPWEAHEFERLIGAPSSIGEAALDPKGEKFLGFLLSRRAADEAEILTLAIDPPFRRQGIGRALLTRHVARLGAIGVRQLFLEVGADNVGARRLYADFDFVEVGQRSAYYRKPGAAPIAAVVLRRDIR